MRISDWSSDVCSSDLERAPREQRQHRGDHDRGQPPRPGLHVVAENAAQRAAPRLVPHRAPLTEARHRLVFGKRVSVRLDLCCLLLLKYSFLFFFSFFSFFFFSLFFFFFFFFFF